MDRPLRDELERTQAELDSALKTAYRLQLELATARRDLGRLRRALAVQAEEAREAAEVRDLLAAAMTSKFKPVPNPGVATSVGTGLAFALAIAFGLLLFRILA